MGIVKRQVNARHWPREDRAGFLGVVTDRYDEVNGLIHDGGDVLGIEPLRGQMRELQGGNGPFGHLRLRTPAGGQSTNLITRLVSENSAILRCRTEKASANARHEGEGITAQ